MPGADPLALQIDPRIDPASTLNALKCMFVVLVFPRGGKQSGFIPLIIHSSLLKEVRGERSEGHDSTRLAGNCSARTCIRHEIILTQSRPSLYDYVEDTQT